MKISTIYVSEHQYHGYGNIGLNFHHWLPKMGVEILPHDQYGWDRMVIYSPPRATYLGQTPRPDVIYHTMYEARPVPESWVHILNSVGLVWTPSQWCADVFAEHGVKTPMMVAGYGYDQALFTPVNRKGRHGPLKVLVWADVVVSRKRVLRSMEVFARADIPGATLEIKLNDPFFTGVAVTNEDGSPADNVRLLTQPMNRKELVQWLEQGDVLLYLSGGEGFGLQPMEAMATGLPVIAMRQSGHLEYMVEGSVLEVPSLGFEPAPSLTAIYKEPAFIYSADLDAAVAHLQWVAANRDAAAVQGMVGYEAVRHRTWEWAAQCVADQFLSL